MTNTIGPLKHGDPEVHRLIQLEQVRQNETINLIPSENIMSAAVREAVGSVLANKYSEGYPGKRYYQGNKYVDDLESLAINRAKKLFGVPYVNVQAYSGSPANTAIFMALLEPKDKVLGMALFAGGHLTHGHPKVTHSGKLYTTFQYHLTSEGLLNYDEIIQLAREHKPKLIVSGATAYPRIIDFSRINKIASEVGAYHVADISHISGLVVGGAHPSPVPDADVIMTTTHKSLRGPRGAIIMVTEKGLKKDPELGTKIDKAVFPGLQGGPHNNITAGIAVCLQEATSAKFTKYAHQTVANCHKMADELIKYGFDLISGGTDNHLLVVDLHGKGVDGWAAGHALECAGLIVNKNSIPNDPSNVVYPYGIRLGTPAVTSRGFKEKEMVVVSKWINSVIEITRGHFSEDLIKIPEGRKLLRDKLTKDTKLKLIGKEVKELCKNFSTTS